MPDCPAGPFAAVLHRARPWFGQRWPRIRAQRPWLLSVQYPAALRASAEAIGAITIPASSGARIPLAQLAEIRLEAGPVQVNRDRAQRLVVIQANVRGRDLGGFAREVQQALGSRLKLLQALS